jgi:RNA polymerase sigma factor (sigma-70 family)
MAHAQLNRVLRHLEDLREAKALAEAPDADLLARFTAQREEAAFTALVRRHGPMVLSVCRRVLRREADAEDAFQATFLVLARKASTIRKSASVGSWLHGVARRLAVRAKSQQTRRRDHEQHSADRQPTSPDVEAAWHEVQTALDAALAELPEKYRSALVLCYLEGKSHAQAAQLMGCPVATIRTRVARGRTRLRGRLIRRGLTLSIAGLAALLLASAAPAAAPAALVEDTVNAASAFAAGQPAAALCTRQVAGLVERGLRMMLFRKIKTAMALVLAVGVATAACGLARSFACREGATLPAWAEPPQAVKDGDAVLYGGHVLDPDGKPVRNARVFLLQLSPRSQSLTEWARTGEDGRYRFTVPKSAFDTSYSAEPWKLLPTLAVAEGFGIGMPDYSADRPPSIEDMMIRLIKDDVPLRGGVLDLQGKPIAGARVQVRGFRYPLKGDLTPFIEALKSQRPGFRPENNQLVVGFTNPYNGGMDLDALFPPAVTDAAGRFQIKGIGLERVADLLIEGPGIETRYVYALTRPGNIIEWPAKTGGPGPARDIQRTHYGAVFDHVAAPSKPVVGTVRDVDTGKPIAGAIIEKSNALPVPEPRPMDDRVRFRAVTDAKGRYRITGLPREKGIGLRAAPPSGQPYVMSITEVPQEAGLEPVTVDFSLKRGVWIDVKVTDKVTGKRVPCGTEYLTFEDNPNLKAAPGLVTDSHYSNPSDHGTFRLIGLPGRGVIAVLAQQDRYLHGIGAEKIKGLTPPRVPRTVPHLCLPEQFHAVAEVNPAKDADPVTVAITLDPGRTLTGTVLGPDGKPLAGALVSGLTNANHWDDRPLKTAEFTLTGIAASRARLVQFTHPQKRLAGFVVVKGDEKGPLSVQLGPAGALTGRVLTAKGKPVAGGEIISLTGELITPNGVIPGPLDVGSLPGTVRPDKEGNFRIEGLTPGLNYKLHYSGGGFFLPLAGARSNGVKVKAGETTDLGDVQVRPMQ